MNLLPSVEKYFTKSSVIIVCFGGHYTAENTVSSLLSTSLIDVACFFFCSVFLYNVVFNVTFNKYCCFSMAVPSRMISCVHCIITLKFMCFFGVNLVSQISVMSIISVLRKVSNS